MHRIIQEAVMCHKTFYLYKFLVTNVYLTGCRGQVANSFKTVKVIFSANDLLLMYSDLLNIAMKGTQIFQEVTNLSSYLA